MSEEDQELKTVDLSQEQEEPAPKQEKKVRDTGGTLTRDSKGTPKNVKGPIAVTCSPKVIGTMFDTERQVRIPAAGQNAVQISDVKASSWLWCQMDAGLIIKVR